MCAYSMLYYYDLQDVFRKTDIHMLNSFCRFLNEVYRSEVQVMSFYFILYSFLTSNIQKDNEVTVKFNLNNNLFVSP